MSNNFIARQNAKQVQPPEDWPVDELEPVTACPVCGAHNRSALYTDLTDRVFHCAPGTWSIFRCSGCGSAYLSPRPTVGSIGRAYLQYHTHTEPESSASLTPQKILIGHLRFALRNGYINRRYGYNMQPSTILGYYLAPLFPSRKFAEDRWLRHLHIVRPNPNLLDVGCGNGTFLLQMQALGWNVQGVDPDPNAVAYARQAGVSVHQGTLPEITFPENNFDAITLSHVVEHLHDLEDNIRVCYRILRPGGVLWIATPNLNSIGHHLFGKFWIALDPPRHLTLFTPDSLKKLIKSASFEVSERPLTSANWITYLIFQQSHALLKGGDPINYPTPLPLSYKLKATYANLKAWLHPELSEELVLLAWKPK